MFRIFGPMPAVAFRGGITIHPGFGAGDRILADLGGVRGRRHAAMNGREISNALSAS